MTLPPDLHLLTRLDRARSAAVLRHPTLSAVLGVALPVVAVAAFAGLAADRAAVDVTGAAGGATLAMLLAGGVSQICYGALFRPADAPFLRRLGVDARALFLHRTLRILGLALGGLALMLIPVAAAGMPLGRPLSVGLGVALAASAVGGAGYAGAARAMAGHPHGAGWGCLGVGMWDREVAGAAPLVWAPLVPFLSGTVAGAWIGAAPGAPGARLLAVSAVSGLALVPGARWYADALPRFGPQALEFAFAPPPDGPTGELALRRGLAWLLPPGAALARARDALVIGRRFAWAERLVWPAAIGSFVALARWGELAGTRQAVAATAVLVLLAQGAAGVGLGRLEGAGRRWIDHAAGIRPWERLLGRWAWGWGASLWLTVPLALTWSWWSGVDGGWGWVAAGAATAGVAAVASVAAAGGARR